jgi:hypothetical protein
MKITTKKRIFFSIIKNKQSIIEIVSDVLASLGLATNELLNIIYPNFDFQALLNYIPYNNLKGGPC